MGVRMENSSWSSSRRSPVIEYQAIPRHGPASPFKGHLSTKSNAFCIDSSSRRLSNQYLIRDHMAVHYNKILSAKAAVDCSVPKSRLNSIQLSDQHRREKLKKEIEKCEKEMSTSKNVSRSSSRESRRPLSATYRKHQDSLEAGSNIELSSYAPNEQKHVSGSLSSPEKQISDFPDTEKYPRKAAQKASNISVSRSSISTTSLHRFHSRVSCSSSDGIVNCYPRKAQKAESKVQSGDLLEKHSEHFTNGQQPFTPRTLKSDAKSFLSQYRYYTPAKRKSKEIPVQHVEAETQTDISGFQLESEEFVKRDVADFQKIIKEVEDSVSAMADKCGERKAPSQFSSPRVTSPCSGQSPMMRKIQAEEEELLYLSFIQDITDEILKLGLFSNRALERLFERHIEQNKNHLNETKMRHLLEILKEDLGCKEERKEGFDSLGRVQNEPAEYLQLPDKPQTEKSKELSKAMDLIASAAAISRPPVCSDAFHKVEGTDEFSKDLNGLLNAGLYPPSCPVLEENPITSSTLPPTLSSTTCDADFETSESLQELDELQESMAESLHITTDNAE
ncbi:spermatogenesis-associated protein 7 [Eublepharis macularius]|uniref:Spermatogenesis-associated protein 7 n=1 Tax=Eublepharis macularius TaxID=481883 RepID=A0AA97IZ07_EUBMA|nr:spermatogenesis-associated protein 7 [Eublepharis macularius]